MSYDCVLKCGKQCNSSHTISQGKWESLQSKTKNWLGLDKFGDVYNITSWKDGPKSHHMHQICYISVSSTDKLEKARQGRKESETKFTGETSHSEIPTQSSLSVDDTEPLPPKCLRSAVGGPLHDRTKCVWCMQGADDKHPNRARGKLYRLKTHSAWHSFKHHQSRIEDGELRDRLTQLTESTSVLSDPFANDIMYHHACWL